MHSEVVDPYVEDATELMKALASRHSAMNRLGEACEVAAGVAWLCSDAASFVNGTVLRMDDGETTRLYSWETALDPHGRVGPGQKPRGYITLGSDCAISSGGGSR